MGAIANDLLVAFTLFLFVVAAFEVGFRFGRHASKSEAKAGAGQIGTIQGALLGLLGLLLAFTFSAAGSRFLERQDLIVAEANAIGTSYLRADLIDEPHRSDLRSALRRYTAHRIELAKAISGEIPAETFAEFDRFHSEIWDASTRGASAKPESMLLVVPAINEVIDLHALRLAASRKHVPLLVMGLLIAASGLAISAIGYGCGVSGERRTPLTLTLALLIGTALWITIDLDHSREGLLRLSDRPLKELRFEESD